MQSYTGFIGITALLLLSYLASTHRLQIRWGWIAFGLLCQWGIGWFGLNTPWGQACFNSLGRFLQGTIQTVHQVVTSATTPLHASVLKVPYLGSLGSNTLIQLVETFSLLLISLILLPVFLRLKVTRNSLAILAHLFQATRLSGAEIGVALSSFWLSPGISLFFVSPYLISMTRSELVCLMTISLSTAWMGIWGWSELTLPPAQLLTLTLMSIPGSLVLSKLIYPETEEALTYRQVQFEPSETFQKWAHLSKRGFQSIFYCLCLVMSLVLVIQIVNQGLGFFHTNLKSLLTPLFTLIVNGLGIPYTEAGKAGEVLAQHWLQFPVYQPHLVNLAYPHTQFILKAAIQNSASFSAIALPVGIISASISLRRATLIGLALKALFAASISGLITAAMAGIILSPAPNFAWTEFILPVGSLIIAWAIMMLMQFLSRRPWVAPRPNPFSMVKPFKASP